jgi:hypothetical protein
MKSFGKALVFGLCVWVIPFIVAMFIYPLRESDRPLFESIMPVTLTLCTVIFSVLYFNRVEMNFFKEGIMLGITWFCVCIIIDLSMFMWGPMQMSFVDYMKDIGITYLLIPAVTVGMGYMEDKRFRKILNRIPAPH